MRYLEGRGLEFTEGIPPLPTQHTHTQTNFVQFLPFRIQPL